MTEDFIICANAGDSRAVLAQNGKAVPLSFDHKPDDPKEKRRIQGLGYQVTEGRVDGNLAVSRALGDHRYGNAVASYPDVTIRYRDLDKDDYIILACDGIWDCLSNDQCVRKIHTEIGKYKNDS